MTDLLTGGLQSNFIAILKGRLHCKFFFLFACLFSKNIFERKERARIFEGLTKVSTNSSGVLVDWCFKHARIW